MFFNIYSKKNYELRIVNCELFCTFAVDFCACGEIGRRARLRIWCLAMCRFESCQAHKKKEPSKGLLFFLLCLRWCSIDGTSEVAVAKADVESVHGGIANGSLAYVYVGEGDVTKRLGFCTLKHDSCC